MPPATDIAFNANLMLLTFFGPVSDRAAAPVRVADAIPLWARQQPPQETSFVHLTFCSFVASGAGFVVRLQKSRNVWGYIWPSQ